jgi:hypothetical protein
MKTSGNFHAQVWRNVPDPPVYFATALDGDRKNTMADISQLSSAESALAAPSGGLRLAARLSSIAKWIGEYIDTMADYYAAATMYEQLRGLSDAELHRRGLSRIDLARHILAARNRAQRPD